MECIKFAIYDSEGSDQKRTTYRVVRRGKYFVIEKYYHNANAWDIPDELRIQFKSLSDIFRSKEFRLLFKNANKLSYDRRTKRQTLGTIR